MSPPGSTAIIFRKAVPSPSPYFVARARSKMSVPAGSGEASSYFSRLYALVRRSAAQLLRPASHSRRGEAARRSALHVLLLTAMLGIAILALMYVLDVREIGLMPP